MRNFNWTPEGGGGDETVELRITRKSDGTCIARNLKSDEVENYPTQEDCVEAFSEMLEADRSSS